MSVCKHVYGDVCMYAWEYRCIYERIYGVCMMHLGIYVCTCMYLIVFKYIQVSE